LKTLARKGRLEMSLANKTLPVKMRWSTYALQKLRREPIVKMFPIISWRDCAAERLAARRFGNH
jgi:hypothetical protein